MGALIPYAFEGHAVRVLDRHGEPWFVLADICDVLGVGNASAAAARFPASEKGITTLDTLGGPQQLLVVNESALYRLIFKSRKPAAERFTTWVTSEVLPSIRRTGAYGGISEGRVIELISLALTQALPPIVSALQGTKPTTWGEVAGDGIVSCELIESLKLPASISRRRVAGRLGGILRDQLARAGVPGPVKRAGKLFYPRAEAIRIAAEHREVFVETCNMIRDRRQLELLAGRAA